MMRKMKKNRITVKEIKAKKGLEPICCLTAYTAPFAEILDEHVDILLVGDSLGMVLYGMDSTLGVTLDMMCNHGAAVVKASKEACVIVDMPFGTYQETKEQAFRNAAEILAKTGAAAVKLEGGKTMEETIKFLCERGVPVMGHIGLMPQSVNNMGGYKYQGKTSAEREQILEDAIAVQRAGAFSIVLEGITKSLADEITEKLNIPTIGIGASPLCDGQVLVTEDMIGMFNKVPKFVKVFGNVRKSIAESAIQFSHDVKARKFPTEKNCFELKTADITEVKKA